MKADRYLFDGSHPCALRKLPCDSKDDHTKKEEILAKTAENLEKMAALQDSLLRRWARGPCDHSAGAGCRREGQHRKACDGRPEPPGCTGNQLQAAHQRGTAPRLFVAGEQSSAARGSIAIFNRSYYEDVLVVQVHDLQKTYQMAPRVLEDSKKDFFEKRYRQIRSYEEYLYENSYRVVKIFLHVSKDEQKKRFLERIDRPEKNWKFSCSDLKERMRFDEYLDTFDEVITATATKHSPWYAIPADQKWYTRYLVSEIVLDALQKSCHEYPVLSDDAKAELLNCKAALEQE